MKYKCVMLKPSNKATIIGLFSILIWASLVAVIKIITEQLAPILAVALIYSFSAITVLVLNGVPKIQHMPKIYVWGCGALFVCYEILFLISLALSQSREQVLVIAMINYLWPPLTIVFSIFAKQLNYHYPVILGFLISVFGLMMVVNPEILNFQKFIATIQQNPLAFSFAFIGALLWSCFSILIKKYAQGHNATPLFFVVTAISLWFIHFVSHETFISPSLSIWALIIITGALIGVAYSNWNQSFQFGNIKLLILATYFMPIFSSMISMLILNTVPEISFWIGASLVAIGALICWKSTWENRSQY